MPKPYRPSNGTEGADFREAFCYRCRRDAACPILAATFVLQANDPAYPREWIHTADGAVCTAFEKREGQMGEMTVAALEEIAEDFRRVFSLVTKACSWWAEQDVWTGRCSDRLKKVLLLEHEARLKAEADHERLGKALEEQKASTNIMGSTAATLGARVQTLTEALDEIEGGCVAMQGDPQLRSVANEIIAICDAARASQPSAPAPAPKVTCYLEGEPHPLRSGEEACIDPKPVCSCKIACGLCIRENCPCWHHSKRRLPAPDVEAIVRAGDALSEIVGQNVDYAYEQRAIDDWDAVTAGARGEKR